MAKGIKKKAGGKFKGGSRESTPIVGMDAPPIWVQPNTLDDVPLEAVTKSKEAVPKIAAIDTTQKATNFPECIMVQNQGGDNLYFGHKPWVKPPAGSSLKYLLS